MKKTIGLFSILMFSISMTFIQPENDKKSVDRIEFEKDEDSYKYSTPCGNKGFLMHGPDKDNGSKVWKFHKFSTELKEIESFSFRIGNKMKYKSYVLSKDKSHVYIFLYSSKKKSLIIDYNINTGVAIEHEFKFAKKVIAIFDYYVVDNKAYFRSPNHIFSLDLNEDEKVANSIFNTKGGKSFYSLDMLRNEESICVSYYDSKNDNKIYIVVFDKNGDQSSPIEVELGKGVYASSANVSQLPNGSFIISGGYSFSKRTFLTEGMFTVKYTDRTEDFTSYSFNDILGTEKSKILGVKTKKDKTQTRNILTHQIKVIGNEAILIAEVYQTIYRTETTTTRDASGNLKTSSKQVFVGHQFFNGIALTFDENGKYTSKSSIYMNKMYYPKSVDRQLRWIDSDKYFRFAMVEENSIHTFQYYSEQNFFSLSKYSLDDGKLKYSDTEVTYWYDNYLLAYGYQKIKTDKNRKVYFMSRVKTTFTN